MYFRYVPGVPNTDCSLDQQLGSISYFLPKPGGRKKKFSRRALQFPLPLQRRFVPLKKNFLCISSRWPSFIFACLANLQRGGGGAGGGGGENLRQSGADDGAGEEAAVAYERPRRAAGERGAPCGGRANHAPWPRGDDDDGSATVVTTTNYSPEYYSLRDARLQVLRQRCSVLACRRRGSQRVTTHTTHTTTHTTAVQRDRPRTLLLRAGWPDLTPREVIDALESQLGDCSCVRGVRAQPGECYICVSQQQEVRGLLRAGLNLRGQHLPLRDVTRDSLLVCLAGVPHHVDDSTVVLLANNFGTVISEVERRTYKGVDTGERLLRIKPHASSDAIPPSIVLAGSSVEVKVLEPHDFDVLDDADMPQLEPPPDQQTACSSSDNSFGADSRFRSQLNVRLKLPDASPMPSPPPPPFFQTLPACRRAPPWPAIDPPQPTVPSNPFAADYQATLPCGARLHTPDVAGNPFTFPQVAAGYFEQEEALTYVPPEETTPHRAPPSGDSAPVSSPSSPAADKRPSKKASIAVQQSETITPPGAPAGRRDKLPRKTSSASQGVADVEAAAGGPSATSTPSARKKSANRKVSAVVAGDPVVDLSRCSSSSGQDSPTKSERRRRVSIHFNKRSVCGRKDSVAVGNGTGQQRIVSQEQARVRLEAGDGTTTSERERTNSVSSKSSSAVGGVRRNHAARDLELVDRKVPWCGCWGNGCI